MDSILQGHLVAHDVSYWFLLAGVRSSIPGTKIVGSGLSSQLYEATSAKLEILRSVSAISF